MAGKADNNQFNWDTPLRCASHLQGRYGASSVKSACTVALLALASCSIDRYMPYHCEEQISGIDNSWTRVQITKAQRDSIIATLDANDYYHDREWYEFWFENETSALRLCSVPEIQH
jgi:hypothetical protein